jgi:mono/diheme cytochrome c family protein
VVPESGDEAREPAKRVKPNMLKAPPAELVPHLSHASGWWRDHAQQQIVARGDESTAAALRQVLGGGDNPLGRLHALYTLEGMGKLDAAVVEGALTDGDPRVRVAALRLAEPLLAAANAPADLLPAVLKLANDPRPGVRLQFLFTASGVNRPEARSALAEVYAKDATRPYTRDAVLSGLRGGELEFLAMLLADESWAKDAPGRGALLGGLAACVFREAKPERVAIVLAMMDAQSSPTQWRQTAMLQGVAPSPNDKGKAPRPIPLDAEPPVLAKLAGSQDPKVKQWAAATSRLLTWPGKPAAEPAAVRARPLTKQEQASFDRGRLLFSTTCAACHMPDALGSPGKAPSMRGSEILLGHEARSIRVVLHGLRGKVTIAGETAEMEMPTLSALNDEQIADVLTYARNETEWGHAAGPVTPAAVAKVREETKERGQPWTKDQLKALKLPGDAQPAPKPKVPAKPTGA